MITISISDKETPEVLAFAKKQWDIADHEHYGHEIDWDTKKKFITATQDSKIVGSLELSMLAGVMHIVDIIVEHSKKHQGIGKMLMQKAEDIAKENKMHKIYLETGKTWPANAFYKALGYKITGEFPKHYGGQAYVIYTKFLT